MRTCYNNYLRPSTRCPALMSDMIRGFPCKSVADPGGRGAAPPIGLTNFCINVKSNPRMHQNPPFSGKNSFYGLPRPLPLDRPPIMKFWIRHCKFKIAFFCWDLVILTFDCLQKIIVFVCFNLQVRAAARYAGYSSVFSRYRLRYVYLMIWILTFNCASS